jgi:head-tail adaptor
MQAGRLRLPISIQQDQGTARGSDGAHLPNWIILGAARADIKPLAGHEVWFARRTESEIPSEVTTRYAAVLANLSGSVRVIFGTRVFHLVAARNTDERQRELVLGCTEAPDKPPYAAVLDPAGAEITDPSGGIIEEHP